MRGQRRPFAAVMTHLPRNVATEGHCQINGATLGFGLAAATVNLSWFLTRLDVKPKQQTPKYRGCPVLRITRFAVDFVQFDNAR